MTQCCSCGCSALCTLDFFFSVFAPGLDAFFRDFLGAFSKSPFFSTTMSKRSEDHDITFAQTDAIITTIETYHKFNRKIAKDLKLDESTIKKVKQRVQKKIDKKNISSLQTINIKQSRPRNLKFFKLNIKDRRRLIKYTIKNKANRRKF